MERLNSKWIATVASIWIQCSCGAYTFGIYSSVLKSSQGYDQSTLDTVAVFKDIGSNAGVLAGVLYSAVAVSNNRNNCWGLGGPWVVHLAGAIQNFLGYILMWACVVGLIQPPPVAVMCLLMLLGAHSMTFFTTANMVSGVQNFPHSGGTIVGIMKGFLGISGAIVIQMYDTFWEGKPSTFLLILALLPTFVSLVLMFFVRIHRANTGDDKKHLNGFSTIALIIAGYLMIIIILENIFILTLWARIFTFTLLLLLLASPLGIAIKAQKDDSRAYHELPSGEGQVDATLDDKIMVEYEEGMNLLQAMSTLNKIKRVKRERERETVEGGVTTVLAPTDAAGGVEVLLDEVAALLEVVDAFDAIAPLELLPQDLRLLDVDPLLPHQVLPHLQHRHRVLVRIRWIEVIRRRLIELQSLLSPHFSY
uniref:Nodulin-like domain-containing protein n=1 Tax=Fagus sylvatica TaxID=28930 RepID=A0A2N9IJQ4_FAGSY